MIIGTIEIEPEDPSKQIKITDDIGFNPLRRNIIRNHNFNFNLMTEKNTKEDIDRLSYQFFDLSVKNGEIKKNYIGENMDITKSPKIDNNNNTGFLYPKIQNENNKINNMTFDGGIFITDKINISSRKKNAIQIKLNDDDINKNDNNIT